MLIPSCAFGPVRAPKKPIERLAGAAVVAEPDDEEVVDEPQAAAIRPLTAINDGRATFLLLPLNINHPLVKRVTQTLQMTIAVRRGN